MTLKERLIRLTGDDYRIVKHCDIGSQTVFFLAGLFIPVIFIICWTSSFITFCQVFDSLFGVVILSLFFAWMITNLYRLLLYTFSKNPLPQVEKKQGVLLSKTLRLVFIGFIATMIAKPIESVLYCDLLDRDVDSYKKHLKVEMRSKTTFYYQKQIDEVISLSDNSLFNKKFLQKKLHDQRQALLNSDNLIDRSGFFLQRLRFLCTRHRSCWWATVFFVFVFLYPLVLKYQLRNCNYNQLKSEADRRRIDLNYYAFRKKYTEMFEIFYERKISPREQFEDPPYNTVRKREKRFFTEKEFISELYHV